MLDEIAAIGRRISDFQFIPALSHGAPDDGWEGETGLIHEVVQRHLRAGRLADAEDAFTCGPPPMIDAVLPVLRMSSIEPEHIYFDKFTPATR